MKKRIIICLPLFALLGCSSQNAAVGQSCSKVNALPSSGSRVAETLKDGSMPAGWGGVLDLLENPGAPDTSPRQRCTVHMDYAPAANGQAIDPNRIAFWTAEHCLKWGKATGAELNVFDPKAKKYVRFAITLDELDRYKKGRDIFSRVAPNQLAAFDAASARPSTGLIERGTPSCKADTAALAAQNTNANVICSTVLDLARIEGSIATSAQANADLKELLARMRTDIQRYESENIQRVNQFASFMSANDLNGMIYWLQNWRPKMAMMTRWRGLEGYAQIIEQVRQCSQTDNNGLCHPEVRDFFSAQLDEYTQRATANQTYSEFIVQEITRPLSSTSVNLQWLLFSQKKVKDSLMFFNQATIGTNFRRKAPKSIGEEQGKTLGTSGALYYANSDIQRLTDSTSKTLTDNLVFNDKTMLYKFDATNSSIATFLLQPGDSGTVLLVGNIPIGVVSTVNGKETSGGSAILPLPNSIEEEEETTSKNSTVACK